MKNLLFALMMCSFCSCNTPPTSEVRAVTDTALVTVSDTETDTVVQESAAPAAQHHDRMEFINYDDNGDYFLLAARKGKTIYSFINSEDTSRNLNRGDLIDIAWKDGIITLAGDGERPQEAKLITAVKKAADGPVSGFRKIYPQPLTYSWPGDEEYTAGYKNEIYLMVEYYIATTNNPLLQLQIKNKGELSYSFENTEKNDRAYTMVGIAVVNDEHNPITQWLYIDKENGKLYEYDLPRDELIPVE